MSTQTLLSNLFRDRTRRVSRGQTLVLKASKDTCSAVKKDDFTSRINEALRRAGFDFKPHPTMSQRVQVRELAESATIRRIYEGMSPTLKEMCLSRSQIIQFVDNHEKWLNEHKETFFLMRLQHDFVVVCVVRRTRDVPGVYIVDISDKRVWLPLYEYRFVIPQKGK